MPTFCPVPVSAGEVTGLLGPAHPKDLPRLPLLIAVFGSQTVWGGGGLHLCPRVDALLPAGGNRVDALHRTWSSPPRPLQAPQLTLSCHHLKGDKTPSESTVLAQLGHCLPSSPETCPVPENRLRQAGTWHWPASLPEGSPWHPCLAAKCPSDTHSFVCGIPCFLFPEIFPEPGSFSVAFLIRTREPATCLCKGKMQG